MLDSNYEHLERIPAGALYLEGTLSIPADARGIALFPYNIDSEQRISYTTGLAELMRRSGLATLLVDLLASEEKALEQLHSDKSLEIIRGATNIFEDPKTQEDVARIAAQWFERHLGLG